MRFKLSSSPAVIGYSESEAKLFAMLSSRPKSSSDLTAEFYKDVEHRPFFDQKALTATITTLMRKVDKNNEPFSIVKSARRGSQPATYHVEERKPSRGGARTASAARA